MADSCPKCGSSRIKEFDSDIKKNYFLCRNCDARWAETHAGGIIFGIASTILSAGLYYWLGHNGDSNGDGDIGKIYYDPTDNDL